ncbi:MAG: T9SS type A sorting domain-containing protein [Sphingobacteriales bacterium]|nr:MAG: T9SS type A sorting domain-containing protein [Sphingobacteriales bacterium]
MKTSVLLFISLSAAALITLNSNSNGPATAGNGNRTGGPGAAGNCASCHGGGAGTTTMNISLRKKSDNTPATTQYNPGATYVVKVSGNHPSLTAFGFQMMAVKANNTQAGTFANLGSNYHTKLQSGITLVEHHHTLDKTGSEFVAEFDWTAPVTGTGNVTFHGALNAVNKDNSTGGDVSSPSFNMTLAEGPVSVASVSAKQAIKAYPNPAVNVLHIKLGDEMGNCKYSIRDLNGKKLMETNAVVAYGELQIPVAELAKGIYYISIANGTEVTTIPFAKQ